MAGKGLLLLLGLGAAVALTMSKKSAASATTLTPGDGKFDSPGGPVMPASVEQALMNELANETSVANLQELVTSMGPWPLAVTALNARIAQLQANPNPPAPHPAPAPVPIPVPVVPSPVVPSPVAPVVPSSTTLAYPAWNTTQIGQSGNSIGGISPGLPALPGNYTGGPADLTKAIQSAINTWGTQIGFQDPAFQLAVDGEYGNDTQGAVALFQFYVNEIAPSNPGLFSSGVTLPLTVDGLAGPETQEALVSFGDMPGGEAY